MPHTGEEAPPIAHHAPGRTLELQSSNDSDAGSGFLIKENTPAGEDRDQQGSSQKPDHYDATDKASNKSGSTSETVTEVTKEASPNKNSKDVVVDEQADADVLEIISTEEHLTNRLQPITLVGSACGT
ncbi:hypothetical protein EJ02DRAFT_420835 [Clathrospora elynae]|uniref:Uncharacterized protein n=1 Tax=Clathrospora elynae TaxID=706981 RepID=A0A6A5SXH4_9PLEO|nr:hypothetical protein EJ02DRAFT_420835 [Clathrospora elynae]